MLEHLGDGSKVLAPGPTVRCWDPIQNGHPRRQVEETLVKLVVEETEVSLSMQPQEGALPPHLERDGVESGREKRAQQQKAARREKRAAGRETTGERSDERKEGRGTKRPGSVYALGEKRDSI